MTIVPYIRHPHRHLNTIEDTIQFTLEREAQAILRNPDKTIDTTVYRKPTHTNKYLDYSSQHPSVHTAAVVRTLHHRAQTIPSICHFENGRTAGSRQGP